jgi:hypothetical protein
MSMGHTIGYCAKLAQNNVDGRLLTPVTLSGYFSSFFPSYVHVSLMGDPSLRLFYNTIPQNVNAIPNTDSTMFNFTWDAVPGAVGYQVFRSLNPMHGGDAIATSNTNSVSISNIFTGVNYMQVKALFIETSASGQYHQLSLGTALNVTGGVNAVGLMEQSTQRMDVEVYPNPSTNYFTIGGEVKNAHLQVFNITGKLVFEQQHINAFQYLQHHLQTGVYIIKLTQPGKVGYKKLVVE